MAIDSGPLTSGHAVRGIGVMVKEQIDAIKMSSDKEIKLDAFDFSNNDQRLSSNNYDIVHYPYFFPYQITLPPKKPAKKVIVTIQDLIHLIYPKNYPHGIRGRLNLITQKKRLKYVDLIITISETSKKDICRLLDIPSDKVKVIYIAPSNNFRVIKNRKRLAFITKKYKLPKKFVFYLGDVNYNKNIPTLVEACELAGMPLVIGGKHAVEVDSRGLINLMDISGPQDWIRFLFDVPHPEHAHFEKILEKFDKNKKIVRLGYIPDEDVSEVMNLASVYCQPSYYEGFGLPVLEAFSCGVPVVISKTNCLVEVSDGAALIADHNSANDISEKLTEVLKNHSAKFRKNLIKKGFERVKDFSWKKSAAGMVEAYKSVFGD